MGRKEKNTARRLGERRSLKLNVFYKIGIAAVLDLIFIIVGIVMNSLWMILLGVWIIILGTLIGFAVAKYQKKHLRIIKPLPNFLKKEDGTMIQSLSEWENQRIKIKEMIQKLEYGHVPPHPEKIVANLLYKQKRDDGSNLNVVVLSLFPEVEGESFADHSPFINFTVWYYEPAGEGPFPAVIKVSPEGTGTQKPVADLMMERGYAYACFNHVELDYDTYGLNPDGPCQLAYPDYDWGTLGVWAWGAMRVADFLVKEPWMEYKTKEPLVDSSQLIVTGHSRRGKTALLAGALDERFTLTVPNGSGCGGAGSFLILGPRSQGIASIASSKRHESWFQKDFKQFSNNEKALPFDQHFMRALIAPRMILSTDALGDLWANPMGTQAMYEAAKPIFNMYNVPEHNAIHFRNGGHAFKKEDFHALLDFADVFLREIDAGEEGGKKIDKRQFYMAPFDLEFENE